MLSVVMVAMPSVAWADPHGDGRILPVSAFRLTDPAARPAVSFRVLPGPEDRELLPGDRSSAELCEVVVDRPREPGATMKARMSMRLDTGRDAMRPAFALGGIGGALIRVTDVLFDGD
jgi:hypothetical protein